MSSLRRLDNGQLGVGLLFFDKFVGGLTVLLKLGLHPRPNK